MGYLIAKALLENVTVNLCFNKIIYKILLSEKVAFEDLIFINKPVNNFYHLIFLFIKLYNSLNKIKNIPNIEDLCLFYIVDYYDREGNLITEELIENGSNIMVMDIEDYCEKRIDFMIAKNKIFIDHLRKELYRVNIYKENK